MAVEGSPRRVDDACGIRNFFRLVVRQAVQGEVFAGILEEVFLRPAGEQGRRQGSDAGLIIRADQGDLATGVAELADLADPHHAAEQRAPFGEPHADLLAAAQRDRCVDEFVGGPIVAGVLAIGETGHATCLQALEQRGAIAFAIENQREAVA